MAKVIVMPDPNDPGWKGTLVRFLMKRVLWIVLLIVAAVVVMGNVYTIPSDSKGIVLRFGAISGVVDPGLHVKMPFADDVYVIPSERRQSLEFGFRMGRGYDNPEPSEKLMLTKDNKLIEVEWVLHFNIESPDEYVFNLPPSRAEKEKIIRDLCMATMRRIFANSLFDEGLTSGKEKIQAEVLDSLKTTFASLKTGINIVEVLLQETNVSDSIREEYNSVATAEEQVKTMIYQAEAHANKVVPEAEGRASVLINEGEAYKFKRISEAEGEAARLNLLQEAYRLNPELTRLNMWAEGMAEVWQKLNVVFVEGMEETNGSGTLKVLPLSPEMLRRIGRE